MLDGRLSRGEMGDFYPLHRVYVWISTVQWGAGMIWLAYWAGPTDGSEMRRRGENPQVS
jgi:hypothetical protein